MDNVLKFCSKTKMEHSNSARIVRYKKVFTFCPIVPTTTSDKETEKNIFYF